MKLTSANITNYIRVLRTLWLNEGISRVEIAERLGLDKSTITNIVSRLQKEQIVEETSEGSAGPQGGRKPIKLKINKDYRAVAGIEVQPEYCNVVCVNLAGEILISKKVEAYINAYNFAGVFKEIIDEIELELGGMNIKLAGIGLGLCGIVNYEEGVIIESIPLGVTEEFDIRKELSALTDLPVFIENDGNCCCWGELVFNRNEDLQDFIYCLIEFRDHHASEVNYSGLAIGMGIVIGGNVHHGRRYTAGEFRSIFAAEEHPGQVAITAENQLNVKDDAELFDRFSVELSRNIALLANTFALSNCFVGGNLDNRIDGFTGVLKSELDRNWTYPGESDCRVRQSSLREQAVSYGAASMIIDRLFRVPDAAGRNTEVFSLLS